METSATVLAVHEVHNARVARFYELTKMHLENKSEIMAWHGTSAADAWQVAANGLDMRTSRENCYYGMAIYLSTSPAYSHQYYRHAIADKSDEYYLLFVKALVGRTKCHNHQETGNLNYYKPPIGYHSVCATVEQLDNIIYALYDNSQVYVSYLVHYTTKTS